MQRTADHGHLYRQSSGYSIDQRHLRPQQLNIQRRYIQECSELQRNSLKRNLDTQGYGRHQHHRLISELFHHGQHQIRRRQSELYVDLIKWNERHHE